MTDYEATATIDVGPEMVWEVLVDSPGYTKWDSGVRCIDGTISLGEKLRLASEVNPGRTFSLKVTELTPARSMTWFIAKSIPDLGPSFQQFADGLKAEAERRAAAAPSSDQSP
ncbi:MAG: SRPBCC family protein [Acidimicrobiales bacterium]